MMKSYSKRAFLVFLCSLLILASTRLSFAGGPVSLFGSGTPNLWGGGVFATFPIPYLKDQGPLGPLTNSEADALTIFSMNEWDAVATSTFSAIDSGDILINGIPTDITSANASDYLFTFHGAVIDVIYDHDGSICTAVFGCPPGVLGLGGPIFVGSTVPEIASALVLMNGAAINPSDTGGEAFRVVFSQESGHAIGLHHDQTNGAISYFGDETAPTGCPGVGTPTFNDFTAMYPFASITPFSPGSFAASIDHPEDLHAISRFYPVADYSSTTGTITGTVYQSDGVTPVNGVNVIVRSMTDPFGDARSTVTGDLSSDPGDAYEGRFVLTGLTPGTQYTLAIDNLVDGMFPQPPAPEFIEEYWNDTFESGNTATDNPCEFTLITAVAGSTFTADFVLNAPDTTGPSVSLDQAVGQTDPTNVSPIAFTAVFNEPVSDFAADDVTLGGTAGATTATVTETSPNDGTTYTIAVSGMITSGTVTAAIAAGVATDSVGNPNAASTSTDNEVTFVVDEPPPPPPASITVTFRNGEQDYAGTQDTFIRGATPDTRRGSAPMTTWAASDDKSALVKFENIFGLEPGHIPPGATIESATLTLEVYDGGAAPDIYDVAVDWTEATTFNSFGGDPDIQAEELGALLQPAAGGTVPTGPLVIDVTASVANWAAGTRPNYGWLFRPTGINTVRVRSSEYRTVTARPHLSVTYLP